MARAAHPPRCIPRRPPAWPPGGCPCSPYPPAGSRGGRPPSGPQIFARGGWRADSGSQADSSRASQQEPWPCPPLLLRFQGHPASHGWSLLQLPRGRPRLRPLPEPDTLPTLRRGGPCRQGLPCDEPGRFGDCGALPLPAFPVLPPGASSEGHLDGGHDGGAWPSGPSCSGGASASAGFRPVPALAPVSPSSGAARDPVLFSIRPRVERVIVPRSPAIQNAEAALRWSLLVSLVGERRRVPVSEARGVISRSCPAVENHFTLHSFWPVEFLCVLDSCSARDALLAVGQVEGCRFSLRFFKWNRQLQARLCKFRFRVHLELDGIPPHAWCKEVAEAILGPACWIEHLGTLTA